MEDRMAEAQKIVEEAEKNSVLKTAETLIKDNKIQFTHKEIKYRVHLLTIGERDELDLMRKKKFGQLLQDKDILFSKQIAKLLKERGEIDINKLDEDLLRLNSEQNDLELKLGEMVAKKQNEGVLKEYENKIDLIKIQKKQIAAQKTLLLGESFENLMEEFMYKVVTFLSLEKLVEGKWAKAYVTLEDFQKEEDNNLILKACEYTLFLQGI